MASAAQRGGAPESARLTTSTEMKPSRRKRCGTRKEPFTWNYAVGFAFIALYFVWRQSQPVRARLWLLYALGTGLAYGTAQVLRGAHFVSHVAWSAWLCWALPAAVSALSRRFHGVRR